ncbi:GNAT family N-acetyltransferase [Granulicatella seriolae]|uniref:GNAT family N-acetyltransferase n=1 Tax=Granulicatella seriolae TaxID=2967226 RepID=A0ABT1WMF7_9LACT|nr:GNAT family N-acetyltransferase [Granulicatella seriolae]
MITYKESKEIKQTDIKSLYSSVKWTNYTNNLAKLENAINHSLSVITAWDGEKLVGLIRAVGDGETILYIQDILVHPDFQNQQIGTNLMNQMLHKYTDIRQKVLLTEEAPDVRHFYQKFGFSSCDKGQVVAFYKAY